ncbi:pyruvate kinase [Pelagibacterium xiamenense]|uniref:pyruvate kinase n=1 Tax=Pelagibacterium xiamenense TaxID=2901140 RepID=UPI001E50654B|nr:pyruvate kinase [Pelagibacterium xiamenense]MCD7060515.1 pyruvate kinase [Pelagibacterium xiamenense]
MRRSRSVKILATLGPASNDQKIIEELVRAGADVFRINMSHASHDVLRETVEKIRAVEKSIRYPIGILVDLQGPKLRVGKFADGSVMLTPGETFTLDTSETPGDKTRVHLPHPEIFSSVKVGDRLLLDDGKLELKVAAKSAEAINCSIVYGGKLSDRKGVSLPDTLLGMGALTEKDRADLQAGLEVEADWIALSFVQRPEDIIDVRKIVQGRAGVLAKIEKPQAIDQLEEIIKLSDAIMIARGDLGVEMPLEAVPGLQKRMIRMCRRMGKPVVVATQMLESMITAPVPTRAEVSDVSIAVFEGADAIMLSAESASGSYPVQAVATMNKIAVAVEQDGNFQTIIRAQATQPEATAADAISAATRQVAETLDLAAIVTYTSSGSTGIRASRERPAKPIIALSPKITTVRRLSLVWGLHCVQTEDAISLDDMVDRACAIAYLEGIARPGDRVAITAGVPLGTPGATNMLRIAFVGQDGAGGS